MNSFMINLHQSMLTISVNTGIIWLILILKLLKSISDIISQCTIFLQEFLPSQIPLIQCHGWLTVILATWWACVLYQSINTRVLASLFLLTFVFRHKKKESSQLESNLQTMSLHMLWSLGNMLLTPHGEIVSLENTICKPTSYVYRLCNYWKENATCLFVTVCILYCSLIMTITSYLRMYVTI